MTLTPEQLDRPLQPGKQPDGSWFAPVMPMRKDQGRSTGNKFGFARNKQYKQRQADFRSYLQGWSQPLIQRIYAKGKQPARKNVKLEYVIYTKGYSALDEDNGESFLRDSLEGIAYKDDWQIGWREGRMVNNAGFTGIWFRVSEIEGL